MQNRYVEHLARNKKPFFIPFTVLGDPDKKTSIEIVRTLVENGATALEPGFPFSDPPADGPTIQVADKRALDAGITVDDCFDMLKTIRTFTDIPIGLLVYYNLLLQRPVEQFFRDCAAVGVDSVLTPDVPLEHIDEIESVSKKYGIGLVLMVNEFMSDERLEAICKHATGFVYVMSYVGVTGIEDAVLEDKIRQLITRTRRFTNLPLCVGFGINTPAQAQAAVRAGADGVIVGSRIVKEIPNIAGVAQITKELSGAVQFV